MTSPHNPSATGDGEAVAHLAVQVTALRGQVRAIKRRLDQAGTAGPEDSSPEVPAPKWTGLADEDRETQLAGLRHWVDTILRTEYGDYELRACWDRHPLAIWELSTLAAEWQRIYAADQPSLDQALTFYDRWLPGTMRRLNEITIRCRAQCSTQGRRSPVGELRP